MTSLCVDLMTHSGEGSALLFGPVAIFLTFFVLVTFTSPTSYIISLTCLRSKFSFSLRGF